MSPAERRLAEAMATIDVHCRLDGGIVPCDPEKLRDWLIGLVLRAQGRARLTFSKRHANAVHARWARKAAAA